MDNTFIRTDLAGNIKPNKEELKEKVDGAVAPYVTLCGSIRNKICILLKKI